MGDSTSVPTETAQELLASICYTLQFEMAHSDIAPRELLNKDLYVIFICQKMCAPLLACFSLLELLLCHQSSR